MRMMANGVLAVYVFSSQCGGWYVIKPEYAAHQSTLLLDRVGHSLQV